MDRLVYARVGAWVLAVSSRSHIASLTLLLFSLWVVIVVVAAIVAALRGPFHGSPRVVEPPLRAMGIMTEDNDANKLLLKVAGACDGE